jgi:hypothetical protein
LASVTNREESVSRVDFFANTNLIGTAVSPPYQIEWKDKVDGQYALTAQVIDKQGGQAVSRPVNITIESVPDQGAHLCGTRFVTNGVFVFYYNKGVGFQTCVRASDDLKTWREYGVANFLFVDESASVSRRFYRIEQCLGQ